VIECEATDRDEVGERRLSRAFSVPEPIAVTPSRKETVPVGVPEPGAADATVAVNVTLWPNTDGLAEEISATVVESVETFGSGRVTCFQ